jgi:hypothetical protein
MRRIALLVVGWLALAGGAAAAPAEADAATAAALRATLLGRAADVYAAGAPMRAIAREDDEAARIARAISRLAAATTEPPSTREAAAEEFPARGRDDQQRAWERLVARNVPRDRLAEARADRRYDQIQRAVNGVAVPVLQALQGQLFALITLPFEAVDWMLVGRRFLTPEQRREFFALRTLQPDLSDEEKARITDYRERRRELTKLHAAANAETALERGTPTTATFWASRQQALLTATGGGVSESLVEAQRQLTRIRADADRSNTIVGATGGAMPGSEIAIYTAALRGLVAGDSAAVAAAARRLELEHPGSLARGEVAAAAAASIAPRDRALAAVLLADIAADPAAGAWATRAALAARRPEFRPATAFEQAAAALSTRRNDYLFRARDPFRGPASLTEEEARLARQSWITRARALFITDAVARALFMPFLDPFPRGEYLDAAAIADPAWQLTPEGREWMTRAARAAEKERRTIVAERLWTSLGETEELARARRQGARHAEREADRTADPREAAALYARLLATWPEYEHRARVEEARQWAALRAAADARVPRAVLKSHPEIATALGLAPTLTDGRDSNGEVSRDGVYILPWNMLAWRDEDTGRVIEVPADPANLAAARRLLEPRLRLAAADEVLREPLPRKRVPIEVEAGLFPGFDVTPGLVPLEPEARQRRLYE